MPVRLRKHLTTTILVPAIAMSVAAIALLWQLNRQMYETGWVEHTDQVMLLAQTAKVEFLMAANALRDFLISSDPTDRSQMQEHWNESQAIIKQLGAVIVDNPSNEQRNVNLKGLENQWRAAAGGADSTSTYAEKHALAQRTGALGSKVLARVRRDFGGLSSSCGRRDARRDFHYHVVMWGIPIAALILVVGLTLVARREIRRASNTFADALKECRGSKSVEDEFSRRGLP